MRALAKVIRERCGRGWAWAWVTGWAMVAGAGCHPGHRQSSLHPASGEAAEIATLWWFMFVILTVIFFLVMGLGVAALLVRRRDAAEPPGGGRGFIVMGGIILPSVVVIALLFYSLHVSLVLRRPPEGVVIEVTGHQWWWDIRYPESNVVTANEIYIPAGEPVLLKLKSADVVHSFWVPNLHGKMDALPDTLNGFWIHAEEPGAWRGQCAEFCGKQHALMAFEVVALPRPEFDAWIEARQRPHRPPQETELVRGEELFFQLSCNNCHTIRGTRADGTTGPDLTHIASRLTLGAGTIPNDRANLAGWLANPQAIKPGNLMPRTFVDADELHALVDYLRTLE